MKKIMLPLLFLVSNAGPAFTMGSETPVTWLKSAQEIPVGVKGQLSDCTYINEHSDEAWEENGETGGYFFQTTKNERVYIVTCELAASNAFDAAVLYNGNKATRLKFSRVDENGKIRKEDTAGNTLLKGNGILNAGVMAGCVGKVGSTMTYRFANGKFVLEEQDENTNCENPKWKTVFKKKK